MNIYQKLQDMRVALQAMNIKKSGENKFAGYKYYELGDFMPPINQLMKDHDVCSFVSYKEDLATLTLVNAEKPDETIEFTSPMKDASLKGAHAIQNLGAVETYQRRYLYMTAFEIVEADVLDSTQGSGNYQDKSKPQSGGQKHAQQTQQKKNSKLPQDMSDMLNNAIKETKEITGMSVKEVIAAVEATSGIKMADVTVANAQIILNELDTMKYGGADLPF